jgi:hypothetical protein
MKTIKLQFPFKVVEQQGTRELTEITLRRPTVRDLKNMAVRQGSEAEREVAMVAALASLVPEALDAMDAQDYAACQAYLGDCLRPAPMAANIGQ